MKPARARRPTATAWKAGVALLVLAAGVAAGLAALRGEDGRASRPDDVAPSGSPTAPAAVAVPDPGAAATRRGVTGWLAAATDAIGAQRAARLAQLRASRDPADALRLFDLLEACREVRQGRSDDAAACDGVTDADLAGRLDALQRAVEGRAPGAVAKLYEAGPDGDYQHDPGQARHDAWRARLEPLLGDAIRHGDIPALGAAMLEYDIGIDFPRDPSRALTYVLVAMDIEHEQGRDASGLALQAARLSAELTTQQRGIASLDAQRLFVDAFQGKPAQ